MEKLTETIKSLSLNEKIWGGAMIVVVMILLFVSGAIVADWAKLKIVRMRERRRRKRAVNVFKPSEALKEAEDGAKGIGLLVICGLLLYIGGYYFTR